MTVAVDRGLGMGAVKLVSKTRAKPSLRTHQGDSEGFIRRTLNPAIGHLKIRQCKRGDSRHALRAADALSRPFLYRPPVHRAPHMPALKVDPAGIRPAWKQVAAALDRRR